VKEQESEDFDDQARWIDQISTILSI